MTTTTNEYVAMGSSFAAGPGVGEPAPGSPRLSGRSTANYAQLLAASRGLGLTDVSFSGVTTTALLSGSRRRPAQVEAVDRSTRLVTMTVGGNDIGYRSLMWNPAHRRKPAPLAWRPWCRAVAPSEQLAAFAELPSAFDRVVAAVRERSPQALVVLVDYATVLPPDSLCPERAPLSAPEVEYAVATVQRLATVTAEAAARNGTELVRASEVTADHHVCSDDPWVVGWTLPRTPFGWGPLAFHPNAPGMRAIADAIDLRLSELGWTAGLEPETRSDAL